MAGKADIAGHLIGTFGVTKQHASDAVDEIFRFITGALKDGERVQVPGFGTFSVSHRPERAGRNPQTGEAITVSASNVVRFKVGKGLKDAINT